MKVKDSMGWKTYFRLALKPPSQDREVSAMLGMMLIMFGVVINLSAYHNGWWSFNTFVSTGLYFMFGLMLLGPDIRLWQLSAESTTEYSSEGDG